MENGPSLALLVHVLRIDGYARDRGEVRIWKYMNDERDHPKAANAQTTQSLAIGGADDNSFLYRKVDAGTDRE